MYESGHVLDEIAEVLDNSHRYGRYINALCPFHDDHRPSFFVYPDTYFCMSCGARGKTSQLLERLRPQFGIFEPPKIVQYFRNPWTKWVKNIPFERIFEISLKFSPSKYLEDRGIDKNTQRELEIGMMDDWIIFPIKDVNDVVIGGVARAGETNTSESKYILPAGQDPTLLYNPSWERTIYANHVFVTFGILDAVTLYMLGFSALSVTMGKHVNPSSFDIIRKRIVVVPDLGEDKEARVLASRLGWRGEVAKLQYPDGAKDINDLIWKAKWSREKVREVIHELG